MLLGRVLVILIGDEGVWYFFLEKEDEKLEVCAIDTSCCWYWLSDQRDQRVLIVFSGEGVRSMVVSRKE